MWNFALNFRLKTKIMKINKIISQKSASDMCSLVWYTFNQRFSFQTIFNHFYAELLKITFVTCISFNLFDCKKENERKFKSNISLAKHYSGLLAMDDVTLKCSNEAVLNGSCTISHGLETFARSFR